MSLNVSNSAMSRFVQKKSGNTDWVLRDDIAKPELIELFSCVVEGQGTVTKDIVKSGRHRTVYRVPTKAGNVYLKHYRACDWSNWFQNAIRLTKAEREWRGINSIRRFGINTVEPLALGINKRHGIAGDSFIVTKEIEQTIPLDTFLASNQLDLLSSSMRTDVIQKLACITATLHNNGLIHRDYHAGNFLLRQQAGSASVFLLDLHPLAKLKSLRLWHAEQMLGQLNHFISRFVSRADRLRFFDEYWFYLSSACRELYYHAKQTRREIEQSIEQRCHRVQLQSWNKADRKWRRGNRRLLIHHSNSLHARCLSSLGTDFLEQLVKTPDRLFKQPFQLNWIKQSNHRKVSRVGFPLDGTMHHAFYKMLTVSPSREVLFRFQGGSHVRQAWEFGHALLRRGIPTPKPWAFVEQKCEHESRHFLLTEAASNSVALSAFYDVYLREMDSVDAHRWIKRHAKSLGTIIAQLHASRFDHRDLKSNNVMVSHDFSETKLLLLDLDAVRRWPVLPRLRVIQNLARMNRSTLDCPVVSLTHRLRFLKSYLGERFSQNWKNLWMDIAKRIDSSQIVSRDHQIPPQSFREAA